jgi:hypothetical protein|tara:strand:- start:288 stop:542 length:255 start_codon:yes stop_codon:yes gene_type:complete
MHDEEQDYDYMPGSTIPLQERSDEGIERMLTDALNDVKELSMERNRRIQLKFTNYTKNAIDMFTEYQDSLKNYDPSKLHSDGKI